MTATDSHDTGALKAALAASEARAAAAEAKASDAEAQVAALTLMIEKLRRALYGRRSERSERLLGQLELALDELTASATEDELAAEKAAAASTGVKGFVRRKPSRKPFPDHLPRERVVVPAPTACECCGSDRLSKVGEDVTETLEAIPRRWKVVQTVREKFTCRKLREDLAAAGAVPHGAARLGGPEPAGHDPVREVRAAPAAQPAEGSLRERGRRSQPVDAGRPGGRVRGGAEAAARPDCGPRAGGFASARRRHDRAGAGQGQDRHRAGLGLCARRRAVRRSGPAGGAVPLRAGSFRRSPGRAFADLHRDPAG